MNGGMKECMQNSSPTRRSKYSLQIGQAVMSHFLLQMNHVHFNPQLCNDLLKIR